MSNVCGRWRKIALVQSKAAVLLGNHALAVSCFRAEGVQFDD